jgi:hypothetical protein
VKYVCRDLKLLLLEAGEAALSASAACLDLRFDLHIRSPFLMSFISFFALIIKGAKAWQDVPR